MNGIDRAVSRSVSQIFGFVLMLAYLQYCALARAGPRCRSDPR